MGGTVQPDALSQPQALGNPAATSKKRRRQGGSLARKLCSVGAAMMPVWAEEDTSGTLLYAISPSLAKKLWVHPCIHVYGPVAASRVFFSDKAALSQPSHIPSLTAIRGCHRLARP
jgi:hypothetical protein